MTTPADAVPEMINANSTGKTWRPTPELRWRLHDFLPVPPILQQRWFCLDDGSSEWRDVPTAGEPTGEV